nr:unnamed protein product [Digitaria exilis]
MFDEKPRLEKRRREKGRRPAATSWEMRWGGRCRCGDAEATACGRGALWSGREERRGRIASRRGRRADGRREGGGDGRKREKGGGWF